MQTAAPLALISACALFLLAPPLARQATASEARMSAEAFERYTTGRTLTYGLDGQAYGAERYLPGRRVIWSFLDGDCRHGHWYPQDGNICFEYEDREVPQCWQFTISPVGLVAEYMGGDVPLSLFEALESNEEMICLGPEVGV